MIVGSAIRFTPRTGDRTLRLFRHSRAASVVSAVTGSKTAIPKALAVRKISHNEIK
ncbi:hypothetical protein GCM10023100_55280 [Actinocorallia cavernae]|jgi:hypothetical protein|uniref:Uncharacterized protein n=2 Tax=Actinomycetes TaxID=1760 RepID=A0ABN3L1F4_9ACTN